MDNRALAIQKMIELFGKDEKRINHAMKVLKFSELIAGAEVTEAHLREIIAITAILHDIGIHEAERKYNSNSGKYQELEGPPIARKIMTELNMEQVSIDRVAYIIGGHHTASKNDGLDFQIIWEADLLVNIEEDGLNKENSDMVKIIEKNFRTKTGLRLANELYLK